MRKRLLLLALFGVAMGYMEAVVVVYLREIFYPEGFSFPIRLAIERFAAVEVAREAATIAMLLALAMLAERTRRGRMACFMLLFGIWDITYYVFLWVTLGWPASILAWDVLFLIPVIWTGPVLAPVLVSVLLLAAALMYFTGPDKAERVSISRVEWAVAILGGVVIFGTFAFNHGAACAGEMPRPYPWGLFGAGLAMAAVVLARVWRRLTSSC
jgi:hypothetical protein